MAMTPEERRARRAARHRERMANDPEYRARRAAWKRKWWANNPEHRARENARQRERQRERRANDPEYRARDAAWQRKRRANNPEFRAREAARKRDRTYGPGASAEYTRLFQEQDGRCAICGTHNDDLKGSLNFDHCHSAGRWRGLLCGNCNKGIGFFKDDPEIVSRARLYLISR